MGDQSTLRQRHVDPSTPAAPAPSTKPTISSALLSWDAIDHWRRDNHYITSGYRIDKASYHHTFLSLTHLHNESVNIWSHLLGAVIAVLSSTYLYTQIKPRYDSASQQDVIVFGCFFTGAFLCLGMSATFHALLSHSQDHAKWGNKLDYTGIVLLIVGSYVPALYYGFFCEPLLMRFYLGLVRIVPISLLCRQANERPDLHPRNWLRSRLLGGQIPHLGVATLPRCHVHRAWSVWHHPRGPWRHHLRLLWSRGSNEHQPRHPPWGNVHLRRCSLRLSIP